MKDVTHLLYEQTRLHSRGHKLRVGTLIERLSKLDPLLPVSVCGDSFNFVELDDNAVLDFGDQIVLGIYCEVTRVAA